MGQHLGAEAVLRAEHLERGDRRQDLLVGARDQPLVDVALVERGAGRRVAHLQTGRRPGEPRVGEDPVQRRGQRRVTAGSVAAGGRAGHRNQGESHAGGDDLPNAPNVHIAHPRSAGPGRSPIRRATPDAPVLLALLLWRSGQGWRGGRSAREWWPSAASRPGMALLTTTCPGSGSQARYPDLGYRQVLPLRRPAKAVSGGREGEREPGRLAHRHQPRPHRKRPRQGAPASAPLPPQVAARGAPKRTRRRGERLVVGERDPGVRDHIRTATAWKRCGGSS